MKTINRLYNDWCGGRRKAKLINITRQEWCKWWEETNVFEHRGSAVGCFYMSRIDKQMPFSIDNIELKQKTGRRK